MNCLKISFLKLINTCTCDLIKMSSTYSSRLKKIPIFNSSEKGQVIYPKMNNLLRYKMWYECQWDNSSSYSQFIKVNHYRSKYCNQHRALYSLYSGIFELHNQAPPRFKIKWLLSVISRKIMTSCPLHIETKQLEITLNFYILLKYLS